MENRQCQENPRREFLSESLEHFCPGIPIGTPGECAYLSPGVPICRQTICIYNTWSELKMSRSFSSILEVTILKSTRSGIDPTIQFPSIHNGRSAYPRQHADSPQPKCNPHQETRPLFVRSTSSPLHTTTLFGASLSAPFSTRSPATAT